MKTGPYRHDAATHVRLIVRVLQEVARRESFTREADLKEALKRRCAQLRIRYDAGVIATALDRFEEGGKRPIVPPPAPRRQLVERAPEPEVFTRAEASALWYALLRSRGRRVS